MRNRNHVGIWSARFLVSAAVLVCCGLAAAGESPNPAADIELLEQAAFRAAVDRVAPAVVRIETVGGAERVGDAVFASGPTTGLVVDPEGYIVSSAFAFANRPASIVVRLADGTIKPAELMATDHGRMIVLLKIKPEKPLFVPEVAPLAETRVGQWTIAVGRTFEGNRPNVSVGILSAVGRVWGKAIQTDAAVSPNNYGGPLVDIAGRVLGVLAPLSPQSADELAGVEWYDSGIGFAVDAEHIMKVLPRLKQGKDLEPGLMGISLAGQNPAIAEPVLAACRVNSPAGKAGLKVGDRIIEIDGQKIVRAAGVKQEIARRYAGDTLHVVALRDSRRIEAQIELVTKLPPYQPPFLGVLPMRTPGGGPGVAVRYVYAESPAAGAGIQSGDVLVALTGKPIKDRHELLARMAAFEPDEEIEIEYRHQAETKKVKLKLGPLTSDLPPAALPAPRTETKPAEGDRPAAGAVPLKLPDVNSEAWAYVPEGYDPAVGYGIVVWLHPPGEFDWKVLLDRWKALCDRGDLVLLAPKAEDPQRWSREEAMLVRGWIEQVRKTYNVDPTRVVLVGRGAGGAFAYQAALANRDVVRAVAAVDAPLSGPPLENDPLLRLAVYLAKANKSRHATAIEKTILNINAARIPLTVKDLGDEPRDLDPGELAELARWIDVLDRI